MTSSPPGATSRELREETWRGLGIEIRQSVELEGPFVRATTLTATSGGREIWRRAKSSDRYFVSIEFVDGKVVAFDFSGVRYELDPLTGEVLASEWVK